MSKFLSVVTVVLSFFWGDVLGIPIFTPDIPEECNNFMINGPGGWGYRTFSARNGLIAVFWPETKNFYETDTAVFVFLQDNNEPIPDEPENINLFTEKCTKANFHFSLDHYDPKKSLAEQYFSGRCGRTMIILKEEVENYHVIIAFVSARYVTRKELKEVKRIAKNYKDEIEAYIKSQPISKKLKKDRIEVYNEQSNFQRFKEEENNNEDEEGEDNNGDDE